MKLQVDRRRDQVCSIFFRQAVCRVFAKALQPPGNRPENKENIKTVASFEFTLHQLKKIFFIHFC